MKYLFIGGHTDEELCFGGTIVKLLEQGHDVHYTVLSGGTTVDWEFDKSSSIMGCSVDLRALTLFKEEKRAQMLADELFRVRDNYDFVVTHSIKDRHPLHRMAAEESQRVFNCSLITYIGPWNGEENADYFVEISEQQLEKKLQALACYKSQEHRKYMNPEFIRGWARYNGIRCGKLYAEGFKVVRLVQSL